jgi:hypothetical protein
MEYKELVPQADNLMESTRSIGYSLQAAIADIVDNSIAANARNVYIQFPRKNHNYLTILDDGFGMSQDELVEAMVYGSKPLSQTRSISDLGRFGLGLKMASLSQCRSLTVISKKEDVITCARWDLDFVKEQKKWMLQIPDINDIEDITEVNELKSLSSGTLVIWEHLDLMLQSSNNDVESDVLKKNLSDVIDHLSLVFHRYLNYYEKIEEQSVDSSHISLNILCNGVALEGIDPFLSEDSSIAFPTEKVINTSNSEISITPWVLPYPNKIPQNLQKKIGDLQQYQGFYIYRNKRLVIKGSWFYLNRKAELSKLIRVQVDIPNSSQIDKDWKLDVKKSSATLPESLKKYLKKTVENLSVRSKRTFTKRAKVESMQDGFWVRKETAEGVISYEINFENDFVKPLVSGNPQLTKLLKLLSITLPYDSIYADRADGNEINKEVIAKDEFYEYLQSLPPELAAKIRGLYNGS